MLTQLSSIKQRLAILDTDLTYDALLTAAIKAVSGRFDLECRRTLARTEGFLHEFQGDTTQICAACYPIEAVIRFELKANEGDGWVEQENVEYLVRRKCVISLLEPFGSFAEQARVTYTGGYVLPGSNPLPGQTPLPDDLEQAAIEQVAFWFQNRDTLGVLRRWPAGGLYQQLADADLLPSVRAVLTNYTRWEM